ncbi:MAG TPA: hypothetical protein VHP37_13260 [Burkholderiales bacterium]|jgi:hypothetical protein|nr:hypothetical protein [Burkholderiales bacterium]
MNYRLRTDGFRRHGPAKSLERQAGKLGWIFLWLIGVPIPVLLVLFLLRGCT